jgi:hypothetical protein
LLDINQMTLKEMQVYALYIAGVDMEEHYNTKSTFYGKRKLLLPYGIDILESYRGKKTTPDLSKMRSLTMGVLAMPDWYYLPKVLDKEADNEM